MLATTLCMGGLFGFINSAQQIFTETFGAPRLFTTVFAFIAGAMALSSFVNARIVGGLGPRRLSHLALVGLTFCSAIHAAIALSGHETLVVFALMQAGVMFGFGLIISNFGTIAMAPLGHVAGTASSVQGFVTTFGGALLGFFIGQRYNGTVVPLTLGFSVYGVLAILVILAAERGRLFRSEASVAIPTG
jgi:DHA1 family bicyclomycin/chloramphenicol resistance-like MFS transporter